jgi:thiol-disulfide isomerase/thioredoxin
MKFPYRQITFQLSKKEISDIFSAPQLVQPLSHLNLLDGDHCWLDWEPIALGCVLMTMNPHRTHAKLTAVMVGLAAGALVLAGCSSDMNEDAASTSETALVDSAATAETPTEAPAESAAPSDLAVVVTPLPFFSSTTLEGQAVTQADYEGKPTIMWFWAPWCSVCRSEAPTLSKVASELDGSVDVVGVAALGSIDEMNTFVSDTGIGNFTQLADPDAEVWGVFGVASQPAFAFISADGSIEVVQGSIDEEEILERATTLS